MTDIEFKVGDLFFNKIGHTRSEHGVFIKEFGIIYEIYIGPGPYHESLVKIYWQTTQRTIVYYLSTVKERVQITGIWFHHPVGKQ